MKRIADKVTEMVKSDDDDAPAPSKKGRRKTRSLEDEM